MLNESIFSFGRLSLSIVGMAVDIPPAVVSFFELVYSVAFLCFDAVTRVAMYHYAKHCALARGGQAPPWTPQSTPAQSSTSMADNPSPPAPDPKPMRSTVPSRRKRGSIAGNYCVRVTKSQRDALTAAAAAVGTTPARWLLSRIPGEVQPVPAPTAPIEYVLARTDATVLRALRQAMGYLHHRLSEGAIPNIDEARAAFNSIREAADAIKKLCDTPRPTPIPVPSAAALSLARPSLATLGRDVPAFAVVREPLTIDQERDESAWAVVREALKNVRK